ncbi:hypothetical protein BDW22DRAFT_1391827 [Trametopsis cervina]|nr:hypothetical protein BDW22DRAFT_1391827 [Trametopsis cervina]
MSSVVIEQASEIHNDSNRDEDQWGDHPSSHTPPASLSRASSEEHLVEHLGILASQHHTSEYNRLKFGSKGAPVKYIPLSVQAPQYYQQLLDQQLRYSDGQTWWPCQDAGKPILPITLEAAPNVPQLNVSHSYTTLEEELIQAISSPLTPQASEPPSFGSNSTLSVKTSNSHPINISFLIPTDLIPVISSNLYTGAQLPSPTLFNVPVTLQLPRLILHSAVHSPKPPLPIWATSRPTAAKLSRVPPLTQHPAQHIHAHKPDIRPPALPRQPGLVNFLWNQKIVRTGKAVIATTNAGFKIPRLPVVPPIPGVNHNANEAGKDAHAQFGTKRSSASLLTGLKHKKDQQQHRLPTMEEPYVASAATKSVSATLRTAYTTAHVDKISQSPTQLCTSTYTPVGLNETPRKDVRRHSEKDKVSKSIVPPQKPSTDGLRRSLSDPLPSSLVHHPQPRRTTLGNLFLSSCPGKKVRLTGPVNGRSGVCRDLKQDMQRIKELGVGCIVCCLDDEELEYLGAPWEEYAHTADTLGLDVLRLPTPEGLAPYSVDKLDEHLTRLINTYTLSGTPILVHCRGGVGRAGLVACCWALKLGLCGWIDTEPASRGAPGYMAEMTTAAAPMPLASPSSSDELVERAITLVRRRRSPKAVETFEQVKFLVDYIEFLRTKARSDKAESQGLGLEIQEFLVGSVLGNDTRKAH